MLAGAGFCKHRSGSTKYTIQRLGTGVQRVIMGFCIRRRMQVFAGF